MMDRGDVLCSSAWQGKMCWQAEIWGEEGTKSENRKRSTGRDVTQEDERKEKYRKGYSGGWENRSDSREAGTGRTLVFCDNWYLLQWARDDGVGVGFLLWKISPQTSCVRGYLQLRVACRWNMATLQLCNRCNDNCATSSSLKIQFSPFSLNGHGTAAHVKATPCHFKSIACRERIAFVIH